MARYRGPKAKIARKFGEPIEGQSKVLQKKNYPPGMHGRGRRKKQSEFAKMFDHASRKKGVTGENLLQLLEGRLDNSVYRLGIAPTRRGARQLVSHKHILVNGTVVNIPSFQLKPGDVIAVREKSKSLEAITESLRGKGTTRYSWLEWDNGSLSGKFVNVPIREDIPENIKEQLIVELYSK